MVNAAERGWQLLTPEEAAVILRTSKATIYRRLKGPRALPHRNIDGRLMFSGEDIDTILSQAARGRR